MTNYMNNFKVTHSIEHRGRCHHAVIPRPARTGPGAVRGATRSGIERCIWCTWEGWVPPQFRRAPAPAPPEAILDVNIVLLIMSFLEKWTERFPCYYVFIFREREMEVRRRRGEGTINPRLGNQKKKEVWVSKQSKSSAKTSIAHKQQQQRVRGRTNANTQNALTFLIPFRSRTSPRKPSSSSHCRLRCRLTNHA
jgi:hypothetical protein